MRDPGRECRAAIVYDAFGNRVAGCTTATCSAGERQINDGSQFILARNGSGTITDAYGFYPGGDQPMSLKLASGRIGIFLTDPALRGTVRAIADAYQNATNVEFKTYDISPWGEVAADTGTVTRLRMAGQPYDQGARLYYMRARYYDPELGRFLSEDPIGISGGLNLYAYAGNDPVNKADPTGTSEQCGWAWFEYTYRYIEGPNKGEISRTEYGQEWVCDDIAGPPAAAPSEYPAKGGRKPWQEDGNFEGFGGKPPKLSERIHSCVESEMLSPEEAMAGAAAFAPISKRAVGLKVVGGASEYTNAVSLTRFVTGDVHLPAKIAGSPSLFGAAGRVGPYAAAGMLLFQASEVVACVDAGSSASGSGFGGAGAGGDF